MALTVVNTTTNSTSTTGTTVAITISTSGACLLVIMPVIVNTTGGYTLLSSLVGSTLGSLGYDTYLTTGSTVPIYQGITSKIITGALTNEVITATLNGSYAGIKAIVVWEITGFDSRPLVYNNTRYLTKVGAPILVSGYAFNGFTATPTISATPINSNSLLLFTLAQDAATPTFSYAANCTEILGVTGATSLISIGRHDGLTADTTPRDIGSTATPTGAFGLLAIEVAEAKGHHLARWSF